MINLTEEQRRAALEKGLETRRKNKAIREKMRQDALERKHGLKSEIEALEKQLNSMKHHTSLNTASLKITSKLLLTEEEIVSASVPYEQHCGVYFLISNGRVVYVGQSVKVFSRVNSHTDKAFDSIAIIPCEKSILDRLESLYIHSLRPPLNGGVQNGRLTGAPLSLLQLIGWQGPEEAVHG